MSPSPRRNPIESDLEAIFAGNEIPGDVDVDGVLAAFDRLNQKATAADLPTLLAALASPRNNFWTRELLADPIARLGGPAHLPELFVAQAANVAEGHDNDSLDTSLIEIATLHPNACRDRLTQLLAQADYPHADAAHWLLKFCPVSKP